MKAQAMKPPLFKLATCELENGTNFAAMVVGENQQVFNIGIASRSLLSSDAGAASLSSARCLDDLLQDWERSFDSLRLLAERLTELEGAVAPPLAEHGSAVNYRPPVLKPGKIVCHAQNYADHVLEMRRSHFGADKAPVDMSTDFMGEKAKTWPYAFLKASSSLVGAYDDIVLTSGHSQIDWEAELGVVIGQRGKRVSEENAMSIVAGFMTFNDVSCRDNQWRSDRPTLRSDWFAAKSFDTFAPAGPCMVPSAFVADPLNLAIRLSVNGRIMQNGNTGGLIFTPAEQIAYFSKGTTWFPGDILATGTPAGTGQGLGIFLEAGDIVECEIEGLGVQRNRCVPEEL